MPGEAEQAQLSCMYVHAGNAIRMERLPMEWRRSDGCLIWCDSDTAVCTTQRREWYT